MPKKFTSNLTYSRQVLKQTNLPVYVNSRYKTRSLSPGEVQFLSISNLNRIIIISNYYFNRTFKIFVFSTKINMEVNCCDKDLIWTIGYAILMAFCCTITVKLLHTITWDEWCKELRDQLFLEMKRDLHQVRNYDLDKLHKESRWMDYTMPTCLKCYKKYINGKIKNCPSNTNLLFAIDSTFIMMRNNKTTEASITAFVTFCKILNIKTANKSNISTSLFVKTCNLLAYSMRVCSTRL